MATIADKKRGSVGSKKTIMGLVLGFFSLYVLFLFAWTGRETYWTHYRVTYIQYLEEMAESAQRNPDPAGK